MRTRIMTTNKEETNARVSIRGRCLWGLRQDERKTRSGVRRGRRSYKSREERDLGFEVPDEMKMS